MSHLRLALRRLRRAPVFALSATLTLALGIGGATAAFTVVNAVLVRSLPYADAGRLVDLSHTITLGGNTTRIDVSDATYLLYRRDQRVFTDVGIYRSGAVNFVSAPREGASTAARVAATTLTPGVLKVLGVRAARGRGLVESDGDPAAPPVVVIGDGLWRSMFGGDSTILGRRVSLDGVEHEIVGVMPPRFDFPGGRAALWTALRIEPSRTKSAAFDYRGIARVRDGVTVAAAAAELQRLLPRVPEAFPGRLTAAGIALTHMRVEARPLADVVIGDASRTLWIVAGAIAALLVLVVANVANLFMARAEARQHELAVRRALGASRSALLVDLSVEAGLVAAIGGILGVVVAAEAVAVLHQLSFSASIPRLTEVRVDLAALVFAAASSLAAALIAGWLPTLRSSRAAAASALVARGPRATGGPRRHRARRLLIVSQLTLALMLLAAAGLFTRSFVRLRAVDPGFDASRALSFRVALPEVAYASAPLAAGAISRTLDALRAQPGVRAAGAITKLPLDDEARQDSAVFVEDHPLAMGAIPTLHAMAFASPGYFAAMGIPVVAGRLFGPLDPGADLVKTPREVVVSAAFARKYWTPDVAVGHRIKMNAQDEWSTIVGVVGDVRDKGLTEPPGEIVYSSLMTLTAAGKPWTPRDLAFVVRSSGDRAPSASAIEAAVRESMASVPVYRTISLSALQAEASARTTFTLAVLAVAALLALTIGAVGLYGVTAYLVGLQTRELGIRMALGAQPRDVRRLVLGRALRDAALGVLLGLVGAVALGRAIAAGLYGTAPTDPPALGGASLLLASTALVATWFPARRASRLDPASTLRAD